MKFDVSLGNDRFARTIAFDRRSADMARLFMVDLANRLALTVATDTGARDEIVPQRSRSSHLACLDKIIVHLYTIWSILINHDLAIFAVHSQDRTPPTRLCFAALSCLNFKNVQRHTFLNF
jgi:hypothetical protein